MSDINRILIFCILVGLLYALYRYQDVIFEQIDLLQPNKVPPVIDVVPNQNPPKALTYDKKKVTVDNISQVSLISFKDKDMSNSGDDLSILLDDKTCDSKMTRGTYGSLFDD